MPSHQDMQDELERLSRESAALRQRLLSNKMSNTRHEKAAQCKKEKSAPLGDVTQPQATSAETLATTNHLSTSDLSEWILL